jgi:hypothetical protein
MRAMIPASRRIGRARPSGVNAHSTIAFAALGDHARLPARFFARLLASDGWLAAS